MPSRVPRYCVFSNLINRDTPKWFKKMQKRLEEANSPYLREIPQATRLLRKHHQARYAPLLVSEEAVRRNAAYGRNIHSILPMSKTMVQLTRILVVCDSTIRANLHISCLLQDVSVMTLPLATFEDIESVMKATFDVQDPETGSYEKPSSAPE